MTMGRPGIISATGIVREVLMTESANALKTAVSPAPDPNWFGGPAANTDVERGLRIIRGGQAASNTAAKVAPIGSVLRMLGGPLAVLISGLTTPNDERVWASDPTSLSIEGIDSRQDVLDELNRIEARRSPFLNAGLYDTAQRFNGRIAVLLERLGKMGGDERLEEQEWVRQEELRLEKLRRERNGGPTPVADTVVDTLPLETVPTAPARILASALAENAAGAATATAVPATQSEWPVEYDVKEMALDFLRKNVPTLLSKMETFEAKGCIYVEVMSADGEQRERIDGIAFLGRSLRNNLQFSDPTMSRFHALVVVLWSKGYSETHIVDLDSHNGTWIKRGDSEVYESLIGSAKLFDGDVVKIGRMVLRFGTSGEEADEISDEKSDKEMEISQVLDEISPSDRDMDFDEKIKKFIHTVGLGHDGHVLAALFNYRNSKPAHYRRFVDVLFPRFCDYDRYQAALDRLNAVRKPLSLEID